MEQMGLAQAGFAIEKQGVIGLGRGLPYGCRGRVGELVPGTDDKVIEGVTRIEPGLFFGAFTAWRWGRCGLLWFRLYRLIVLEQAWAGRWGLGNKMSIVR